VAPEHGAGAVERKFQSRKSKLENRNLKLAQPVIPTKAGIHGLVEPRFRGADAPCDEFRISFFEFRL